jgi:coproporphyrinogen III oxidase-like Fe-S oxidoreductase
MIYSDNIIHLKKLLFLILFFSHDGFAFRYPMNIFLNEKLEEKNILNYWKNLAKIDSNLQLYVHNVFCESKCSYCNCESFVKQNEDVFQSYKKYLFNEIEKYSKIIDKKLNSIYL